MGQRTTFAVIDFDREAGVSNFKSMGRVWLNRTFRGPRVSFTDLTVDLIIDQYPTLLSAFDKSWWFRELIDKTSSATSSMPPEWICSRGMAGLHSAGTTRDELLPPAPPGPPGHRLVRVVGCREVDGTRKSVALACPP